MHLWLTTFMIVLSSSFASTNNSNDTNMIRGIIAAKLEKMQNLMVKYQLKVENPPITEEMLEQISKEFGDDGPVLQTQNTEQEFCMLGNRSRYEKYLADAKYVNSTEELAKPTRRELITYPGNRKEILRITYDGNPRSYIKDAQESLPRISVEQIFGMRMIDGDEERLNESTINDMEMDFISNNKVILSKVDGRGVLHEWEFDRNLGFALVEYRRKPYGRDEISHIKAKMTDFKLVDGIMIPHSAVILNQGYQGTKENRKIVEGEKIEIKINSISFNDPNNKPELYSIQWPENSVVYDDRIQMTFRITGGNLSFSDNDIFEEVLDKVESINKKVETPINNFEEESIIKQNTHNVLSQSEEPNIIGKVEKNKWHNWILTLGIVIAITISTCLYFMKKKKASYK